MLAGFESRLYTLWLSANQSLVPQGCLLVKELIGTTPLNGSVDLVNAGVSESTGQPHQQANAMCRIYFSTSVSGYLHILDWSFQWRTHSKSVLCTSDGKAVSVLHV